MTKDQDHPPAAPIDDAAGPGGAGRLPGGAIATAFDAIRSGCATLRATDWSRLSERDVCAVASVLESAAASLFGVQIRVAGEYATRGIGVGAGARSPAHALHQALNITVARARGRITAAESMLDTRSLTGQAVPAPDGVILDAIDGGAVSEGQARVITGCLAKIPDAVDDGTRDACRATLLDQARIRDENGLRRVAEKILLIVDPDGTLNGKPVEDRGELTIGARRADGLTPIRGLLSPLIAEHARVAIEALAKPCPIDKDTPDPRPAALRREQAFGEILHRHLTAGAGPRGGGVRPQVVVTIGIDDLFDRLRNGAGAVGGPCPGSGTGAAGGVGAVGGVGATGSVGHSRPGIGMPPWPTVNAAWADYDGPEAAATARLLACDADIIPQVLGGRSAVLDQGEAERLFTPAQRRALVTRDKGCAFPGCDIPPGWCEAHHIIWWSVGGPTDIDNGVLLCRRHHSLIHEEHWRVRTDGAGGRPWFIPPSYIDPARTPRRNAHFHIPTHLTEGARPLRT